MKPISCCVVGAIMNHIRKTDIASPGGLQSVPVPLNVSECSNSSSMTGEVLPFSIDQHDVGFSCY
jgi:hypothetical protein